MNDGRTADARAAGDSAAVPWNGRHVRRSGAEGDTGAADPALVAVLAAEPADDLAVARAVEGTRLLVAVVGVSAQAGPDGDPAQTNVVEMAAVTLVAPGGQRALPVFSGVDALRSWNPDARPVPVSAARAAHAALAEGCDVIVLDVAGPHTRVLRASMVRAMAQERPWLPAHQDPAVRRAVTAAAAEEVDVSASAVEDGTPRGAGVLGVVLTLRPSLIPDDVRAIAARVGERLATDVEVRDRIDGLAFRLV
ncbi:MAG: SseB family protein [Dermatophilaceae bacterium]